MKKKVIETEALVLIKAVRKNIATAILAAFSFIIALVWRDAIQEAINNLVTKLGIPSSAYLFKIITAVIVSVVCVIFIIIFSKWAEQK